MTTQTLTQETIEMLVGKTIIEASDNWIKLSNGLVIYLEDSEIDHLNM
jgi:hypothetical protein